MNSLMEDIGSPLIDVERAWLRRPVVVLASIVVLVVVVAIKIFEGFYETWNKFIMDCW